MNYVNISYEFKWGTWNSRRKAHKKNTAAYFCQFNIGL